MALQSRMPGTYWEDVHKALHDVEVHWGVKAEVRITGSPKSVLRGPTLIVVTVPDETHKAELNDPPEIAFLWKETDMRPLELILVELLGELEHAIDLHMRST